MSFYHLSPSLIINSNSFFTPFNSNINDLSIIYIPWSNITDKPNFKQIAYSGNYYDLSNLPSLFTSSTLSSNLNNYTL